ncbi:MAG: YfhO family protein [Solobacterium sp.]|nr:YfhO family protein [Solobacterium sp.]
MNGNRTTGRNDILKLFFYCTLLIVLVFGIYLFRIHPFRINNDQMFQYPLFYQEWIRLLNDCFAGKGLPLYSWRLFLGGDFYASMAYYVTGDLFLPLFFLFDIDTALIIETVCCFYISCFAMYGFLKSAGIRQFRNLAFISLIYTFGGWAMLYIGQYMFHRFYAFLPLLFLGAEQYFHHQKRWLVSVSVLILFLQNYYLMWPLSLCLLGYCMVRTLEEGHHGRSFWNDVWKLFSAYAAGLLMSCFLLYPAAQYILLNPRVGAVNDSAILWPLKTIAGFLLSFSVSPFPVYTNISNLFRLDDNGYGYWYSLFITIIPLLVSIRWMIKREHRGWGVFAAVLFVSALIKPLSVLFHGLSDPSMRWTFILQFILLYTASRAMEETEEEISSYLFPVYAVIAVVSLGATVLIMGIGKEYWIHYGSILFCLLMSGLIWYLWTHNQKKTAIILSILEICGYSCLMQNVFYHDVVYDDYRLGGSQLAYLQDTDEDLLYRYYIPIEDVEPSYPNLNISLKYGFLGTRTYNSVYDTLTDPFLHLQGITDHRIDITDPDALTMIGVKYYLVETEEELPNSDFEFVTLLNDSLKVYRNQNYSGFGYSAPVFGYTKDVKDVMTLSKGIYVDEETADLSGYANSERMPFTVTARSTDYLAGEISLNEAGILYLPIPSRNGWKVFVDGAPLEPVSVNGGFIGIPLSVGEHVVELNYLTPGLKTGIVLSGIGFALFVMVILADCGKMPGIF